MPELYPPSDSLLALLERQRRDRQAQRLPRPRGYQRPALGTESYRADMRAGWITEAEFFEDEQLQMERRARARASLGTAAAPPSRWCRKAPPESRQYANPMATTAARDSRLTPQAKALLQVIRAFCGRGPQMTTTKAALAMLMARHVRSVQRYVAELQRFGYIEARTRRGAKGLYIGLVIRITEKVTPFFAKWEGLAAWLAERPAEPIFPQFRGFPEETRLSPKNHSNKIPSVFDQNRHAYGMT